MSATQLLQVYAQKVRDLRRASAEVSEPALAPAFQQLVEGLLAVLPMAARLTVVPEVRNPGVGRPDIALIRPGEPPRAFVELKAPDKPADPTRWRGAHDRSQWERFRELPSWATCNFSEMRLFFRAEEQRVAPVVPAAALRPDIDDKRADRLIAAHDAAPLLRLIETLAAAAGQAPNPVDAPQLATMLAHSARLVRGIVRDRLAELRNGDPRDPLLQVRQVFRDVLYAHPEAGGYGSSDSDEVFSAAFAQTLAFGLLLVREATSRPVGADAWHQMPSEHPLMRTALRVLTLPEVVQEVGIGFDVMLDTINSFDLSILGLRRDGSDPILYFYEDFLRTFDPEAREKYGVYYTPVEVVRFMAGALDRALRDNLGTEGLSDPAVTVLDPATGTGTFPLGIAERVRTAAGGGAMGSLALRDLAGRMFGFEFLVGPYAVAHYRLHHALQAGGESNGLPRLGIYLADTLSEPGAAAPLGSLGFVAQGIADERQEANRIKEREPILAIIGNPPYGRLEEGENRTLIGRWMDRLWDDLKRPVRDAGQGNQLNTFPEFSIAFWRWAMWKLFEAENAPRHGVIAFITNRKFLTGWPYAGLRKMMRERFDRIEIFDLRGDLRRGERAGVEADQGVFNIQVGTAVTLAIADGTKAEGAAASILYHDSWTEGRFSRRAKLNWLDGGADAGRLPNGVVVERSALEDFRPQPFQNGEWVSLKEAFSFHKSGMKSGDDDSFVNLLQAELRTTVTQRLLGRADPQYNVNFETRLSYRPLDRRWFYNDLSILNRPGPAMQRVWGSTNVGLYALPGGTGAGPAVWCHGLLPDYHAFRGSYGGYAFPLHDRRPNVAAPNLSPMLLFALSTAYGGVTSAEDTFDAILCLLSATSYSLRFAEDLEDVFPHIPFPARPETFQDAARLGREIRAVETFSRSPAAAFMPAGFVRLETEPQGAVAASIDPDAGTMHLCADGSGSVSGLPPAVWNFSVSGYPVFQRWLGARAGMSADLGFVRELRDVCGRISELIDLFRRADTVLEATLQATLTREALGFAFEDRDADDGRS